MCRRVPDEPAPTTASSLFAPPPGERQFDERGVTIVWRLLKALYSYGETGAGRIWHRTAKKQLVQVRTDLVLYVDDCWYVDTDSASADADLKQFGARFKLVVDEPSEQFLGLIYCIHVRFGLAVSAEAYGLDKAAQYLLKPLESFPRYDTPSIASLMKDFEFAALRVHVIDLALVQVDQSKTP
eukprot:1747815-Pleurochrysis_carterae.AAC.4